MHGSRYPGAALAIETDCSIRLRSCYFDFVVPAEQADFLDVGPMAFVFPQAVSAIGATSGVRFEPFGKFFGQARVGPNRFAFIAHHASGQPITAHAYADAAKSLLACRARLNIDQVGKRHVGFACSVWVLSQRPNGFPKPYGVGKAVIRF